MEALTIEKTLIKEAAGEEEFRKRKRSQTENEKTEKNQKPQALETAKENTLAMYIVEQI